MIEPTDEMMTAAHEAYKQCGRVDDEATFDEALHDAVTAALTVQPQAMVPVKVTLTAEGGFFAGQSEHELGIFNQGVHFECFDHTAPPTMYDTAGVPTKNAVARHLPGVGWVIEDEGDRVWTRLHVQAVALAPNEIALSDELAGNAAHIFSFRSHDDTPHDICGEIRDASKKLDTEDIEVIVRQKRRPL